MLDLKYGLNYPFPHSVVHIIDNSMYSGELPVVVAEDPSLYSTIVVSGAPMGEDNRMVTINRSDVANVAYGLGSLEVSDIKKYGQAITYTNSLIRQGSPVRFMRVTPDDAAYGAAIVAIQWRIDTDDGKLHVRFKNANWPASLDRTRFKNTDRINDALISALNGTISEDGYTWKQRAFINVIPAGKGSVYNNMTFAVNMTNQSRKPANVRYIFSTIDTRTSQTIEQFGASLININNADRTDAIDSVNTVVSRRILGSSVLVPYINEAVVQELFKDYFALLNDYIEIGTATEYVKRVYASTNVNTFDIIYGNYIYNGTDASVKLPYYQVDTIDTDIVRLGDEFLVDSLTIGGVNYAETTFEAKVLEMSTGLLNASDSVHVGDLYLTPSSNSKQYPKVTVVAGINQYTGAVTSITIPKVFPLKGTTTFTLDTDSDSKMISLVIDELIAVGGDSTASLTYATISNNYPDLLTYVLSGNVNAGDIIAGTDGNTFELYWVSKCVVSSNGSQIQLVLVKYNDYQTYYGLDRNSHKNLLKGTGNVIAWDYTNAADVTYIPEDYEDAVLNLIGYAVIQGDSTTGTVDVVVNGYDGETKVDLPYASKKFGTVPTSVTLNNDAVGTNYDVLSYAPTSVDTFRVDSLTAITPSAQSEPVVYAIGDLVSVVVDETTDKPYKFDPTKGVSEDGSVIYSVTAADAATTAGAALAYDENGNLIFYANYDATQTDLTDRYTDAITPSSLDATIAYIDANTANLYVVSDEALVPTTGVAYNTASGNVLLPSTAHTIIKVTGIDTAGNITSYSYVRRAPYTNNNGVAEVAGVNVANIFNTDNNFPLMVINGYEGQAANLYSTANVDEVDVLTANASPLTITRYLVSGSLGTLLRIQPDNVVIPANYYNPAEYGVSLSSEDGGIRITGGSTGFFDDEDINPIEFKWKYSALLVRAFKGELDKSIMSPTRCPAKYLFDGAYNTIVGANIVPELVYTPEEIINASTIFTEDEKEQILFDKTLLAGISNSVADIDVKAAMYELSVFRNFYGIPEEKRPVGQGSGLSLHLDSGVVDDNTAALVAKSFEKRFSTYNASWDIGGYVDSATGISYTYLKWMVDNMFTHMTTYTVNKPFVGKYASIPKSAYIKSFPDIDTINWEERDAAYLAGGNSWVVDPSGSLVRRSQRTLYRAGDTSDLIQESNARTLSQLVYLLQNKVDSYILEYADDDTLQTMTDDCNIMFADWIGTRVDGLDIKFERDINPKDGGEIVVCYCTVRFRSLVLRVPIIVDVQRRNQ